MHIQKGPYLQDPRKDSVIIMWETDAAASSEVRIYDSCQPHLPAKAFSVKGEPMVWKGNTDTIHSVKAEGLLPGHDYYYEAVSEADGVCVMSQMASFRTAPEEDAAISFLLTAENGGSGGSRSPYMVPLLELMRREHSDFILSVGDIVGNGTHPPDWDTDLFFPFAKLLCNTPFYPCVGNHEVQENAIKPEEAEFRYRMFDRYFAFPHYYSFDYGCAHFCVLDCPSMVRRFFREEEDLHIPELWEDFEHTEQYRFLEQDLAAAKAKWKFVIFHFPPYTSSIYDVRELKILTPLFEKYGVDIVFNSHAILYERSHPIRNERIAKDGVRYILVGGFGEFDHWFRGKSNGFAAKMAARPNYVRVALSQYTLELQAIDYEGKLFDTLVLEKE